MSEKYTYQYVKNRIEQFDCTLLSDRYINNATKLKVICKRGHEWNTTLYNLEIYKGFCPLCRKEIKNERLLKEVQEIANSINYTIPNQSFDTKKSKILMYCDKGHKIYKSYEKFINGGRCGVCARNRRFTLDFVRDFIAQDNYTLLSTKYINNNQKLLIKCDNNHEFMMSFRDYRNTSYRCPKCNISKGEKMLEFFLTKYNIDFISQYRFQDCKCKKTLPFDFYLPRYNICIEYDGKQHYEILEHFGGLDDFITRKIHDTIKSYYCEKNNIKLIRIPYWEFDNIEKIIKKLRINFND